ncbi:hypothetical protein PoB_001600500 [Plakobranchus ocellatus]|uniref:Uncharacterized protein n=1 Tax=Plakobranchus ocellatus TaxID=259542 RepID=A0AAV3Z4F1_9GAST|nr:hypothetical protein PoB_001600500 [Plakobranchus ocellatus]
MAGLEPATEESLQISGRPHKPLCYRRLRERGTSPLETRAPFVDVMWRLLCSGNTANYARGQGHYAPGRATYAAQGTVGRPEAKDKNDDDDDDDYDDDEEEEEEEEEKEEEDDNIKLKAKRNTTTKVRTRKTGRNRRRKRRVKIRNHINHTLC